MPSLHVDSYPARKYWLQIVRPAPTPITTVERVWVPLPTGLLRLIQNLVRLDSLVASMPSHIQGPCDNLV